MSRILSFALFAFATALIVPSLAVTAQDPDACHKCPILQVKGFKHIGIDCPLADTKQNKTTCQEATSEKRIVAVDVEFNCDIPFLNHLPIVNHLFRNAPTEECEIFVVEATGDTACGTCEDGCVRCKPCDCTGCGNKQKEVKVEVICDSGPPFLSNVPYVSRLFRKVHIESTPAKECPDCDCLAPSAKTACPTARCGNVTCDTPDCRADALLQLASHHEASIEPTGSMRDEMMQDLMEVHVENARLEATVEAMEHHMELMEEMFEVRVENAELKAQLKLMERQKAESASFKHLPQQTSNAHTPYTVIGSAHSPHAANWHHAPHGNKTQPLAIGVPAVSYPPVSQNAVRPIAHAAIFASGMPAHAEIQGVAERLRALQKELDQRHKEAWKVESSKKANSK